MSNTKRDAMMEKQGEESSGVSSQAGVKQEESASKKLKQDDNGQADTASVVEPLLDAIKAAGEGEDVHFAAEARVPADLVALHTMGLRVGGNLLSLPMVDDSQLRGLIEQGHAVHAPFGRGEETLTDLKVRKTWQLNPESVTFDHEHFDSDLQVLATRCASILNVAEKVTAKFHKLLIYGVGDFFKPHRDGVHSENQFGTLIIQLPSVYSGGTLCVSKGDETLRIDQSGPTCQYQPSFTAFYSDCLHEVLPLESGFRVCLTFDLCRVRDNKSTKPPASAAADTAPVPSTTSNETLLARLRDWYDRCQTIDLDAVPQQEQCACGQRKFPTTAKKTTPNNEKDGEDEDEEEEEDEEDEYGCEPGEAYGSEKIEWDAKRALRVLTDSPFLAIVLDHLIPRDVIKVMQRDGLQASLWAVRGKDRAKVRGLLAACDALKREGKLIDISISTCEYNTSKSTLKIPDVLRTPLSEAISAQVCPCMVKFFSTATAEETYHHCADTGNSGVQQEYAYQSPAIIMYPTNRFWDVARTLVAADADENLMPILRATMERQEEPVLHFFDAMCMAKEDGTPQKRDPLLDVLTSRSTALGLFLELLPLKKLLSKGWLQPAQPQSATRRRIAGIVVFAMPNIEWETFIPENGLDLDIVVALMKHTLEVQLLQPELPKEYDEWPRQEKIASLAAWVAILGQAACFRDMLQAKAPNTTSPYIAKLYLLYANTYVRRAIDSAKPIERTIMQSMIGFLTEFLLASTQQQSKKEEKHVSSSDWYLRDRNLNDAKRLMADLIREASQPGHACFDLALSLAESVSSHSPKLVEETVKAWFPRYTLSDLTKKRKKGTVLSKKETVYLKGTVVMRALVEQFCLSAEKSREEELVKMLEQRKLQFDQVPEGDARKFFNDTTQLTLIWSAITPESAVDRVVTLGKALKMTINSRRLNSSYSRPHSKTEVLLTRVKTYSSPREEAIATWEPPGGDHGDYVTRLREEITWV